MNLFRTAAFALVALLVAATLVACGDEETSLDPPDISYGEDISEMGMFVTDPRYTVATLPKDKSDWLLFDDIGELFKYRDIHPDIGFQVIWVNDYHSEEWLKGEDAWYVESPGEKSPMGWGIAAFADENDAKAHSEETGGKMMTWEQTDARTWMAPPAPIDFDATGTPSPAATTTTGASPDATSDGHAGH